MIILIVPMVLYFLVLFLMHKYPLNQEAMVKVQEQIAERKAAGAIVEE